MVEDALHQRIFSYSHPLTFASFTLTRRGWDTVWQYQRQKKFIYSNGRDFPTPIEVNTLSPPSNFSFIISLFFLLSLSLLTLSHILFPPFHTEKTCLSCNVSIENKFYVILLNPSNFPQYRQVTNTFEDGDANRKEASP